MDVYIKKGFINAKIENDEIRSVTCFVPHLEIDHDFTKEVLDNKELVNEIWDEFYKQKEIGPVEIKDVFDSIFGGG